MHKKIKEIFNIESFEYVLAIVLVGVTAGFWATFIHLSIEYIQPIIHTNQAFTIKATLYALAYACFSGFLTSTVFPSTKGSGIPQIKLALVALRGRMPKRLGIGKIITTILTLLSGLSFGIEGPSVTISAAFGYLYGHVLKLNTEHKKLLVISGSAAGLSAAFFTPISAVIFTLEEIVGGLNTKFLTPIMISSCIAAATAYSLMGEHRAAVSMIEFSYNYKINLFHAVIVGAIVGIIGALWVSLSILIKKIKSKFFKWDYLYIFFAVIIVALASNIDPNVLGDSVYSMKNFMEGREVGFLILLILFSMKFFTSSISYGTGLSGGLFMPVLFLGAASGLLIGKTMIYFGVPHVEVGAYTLLGMASMLIAVMRTPITAFVMVFEMSRDYDLIFPLMIASVIAYFFANLFIEGSIYEIVAEYEDVHLPTEKDDETMNSMQIEECLNTNVFSLEASHSAQTLMSMKDELIYSGYPVLKNTKLIGVMSQTELFNFIENSDNPNEILENVCHKDLITIYPDQSFLVAFEKMKKFNVSRLPVISRFNTKRLVGIVTAKDVIDYFKLAKTLEEQR